MNKRLAAFASGIALVIPVSFASRARADLEPLSPRAVTASVRGQAAPAVDLRPSLRITPLRELGLAGVNLRLQFPTPFAPYVEGRLGDGVSASRPDGALMIPGTPIGVSGAAAAGWMQTRGVDLGVDVQRFKQGYVSVALGWLRSTWPVGGFDQNDRLVSANVSRDAFVGKLALSF